jgi:hypothetical protein
MTKVAVCLSSNGTVHAAFAVNLVSIIVNALAKSIPCAPISAESALNMVNRENAVSVARANGFSHVLFLDSDMTFPPDIVECLLSQKVDIVGLQYVRRFPPYQILGTLADSNSRGFVEAIDLPAGCLLVKLSVFDKLTAPYFRCVALENKDSIPGMDLTGFEFPGTMDEGYYFCRSARKVGFKVWTHTEVSKEVVHYGMIECRIPEEK